MRLRRQRQRYTSPRRQLVNALAAIERPHTIVELLNGAVEQSQSSLYRNLSVLEVAGVVIRLPGSDDTARFELAEDVTGHHHHHLVCTTCGRVEDVEFGADLESALDKAEAAAERQQGFRPSAHRIEIRGTCRDCA